MGIKKIHRAQSLYDKETLFSKGKTIVCLFSLRDILDIYLPTWHILFEIANECIPCVEDRYISINRTVPYKIKIK